MQLAMKIIWIIACGCYNFHFACLKLWKKCPFLKLNFELMDKEQDFIFGWKNIQTVKNTQKKKIVIFEYCHILFWGLFVPHPNLGKLVQ